MTAPPPAPMRRPLPAVPPEGPTAARIVVIGEAPWKQEVAAGRPFAGEAGKLQDRWWRELGIQRTDLHILNLHPYEPPRFEIDSLPTEEIVRSMHSLHERIAALEGPVVLVPLGNYATYALTGKGKVRADVRNSFTIQDATASAAEKKAGITKLRGSIYPYRDLRNRPMKVIPITHPAAVMGSLSWEKRTVRDWARVLVESISPELNYPARRHIVAPSEGQVADFLLQVQRNSGDIAMSVDIETWGNQLSCVGFAISPYESITLPTIGAERAIFLPYVKKLCESAAPKILCNGFYDWYWLAWYGVWLQNYLWDVQLMHHAIDPAENHSLDFLASIYCPNYQFWKDEAKDAEEIIKYAYDLEALWVYNGLDCCYTRELLDLIYADLERNSLTEFYFRHYQQMLEPLTRTMLHGFKVDKKAQKQWAKKLRGEMKEIHDELNAAAGEELFATEEKSVLRTPTKVEWAELLGGELLDGIVPDTAPKPKFIDKEARARLNYIMSGANAGQIRDKVTILKKDFSNAKLLTFFYETLGLPKQFKLTKGKKGRQKTISLDEGCVRKLTAKWPQKIGNFGNLLLAYREKKKELDYLKGAWDSDGRIRCSYKMLTEAGRLASSKNPRGSGFNLQNIKR